LDVVPVVAGVSRKNEEMPATNFFFGALSFVSEKWEMGEGEKRERGRETTISRLNCENENNGQ